MLATCLLLASFPFLSLFSKSGDKLILASGEVTSQTPPHDLCSLPHLEGFSGASKHDSCCAHRRVCPFLSPTPHPSPQSSAHLTCTKSGLRLLSVSALWNNQNYNHPQYHLLWVWNIICVCYWLITSILPSFPNSKEESNFKHTHTYHVYMFMYVYTYKFIYVCICIYTYMHVYAKYIPICIKYMHYICKRTYTHTYMWTCVCTFLYANIWMFTHKAWIRQSILWMIFFLKTSSCQELWRKNTVLNAEFVTKLPQFLKYTHECKPNTTMAVLVHKYFPT